MSVAIYLTPGRKNLFGDDDKDAPRFPVGPGHAAASSFADG